MKKRLKLIIVTFLFCVLYNCSSCFFAGADNIRTLHDSHGTIYVYYDKVMLEMTSPEDKQSGYWENIEPDRFYVANDKGQWCGPILTGLFEKAAFHNGKLFIVQKDTYYVFNVAEYHYQENRYNEDVRKDIQEYTTDKFAEVYPDYEEFRWFNE